MVDMDERVRELALEVVASVTAGDEAVQTELSNCVNVYGDGEGDGRTDYPETLEAWLGLNGHQDDRPTSHQEHVALMKGMSMGIVAAIKHILQHPQFRHPDLVALDRDADRLRYQARADRSATGAFYD